MAGMGYVMVKFVFFDLDDTVLDFHKAERRAIKTTLKEYGIKPKKEVLNLYSKINLSEWKRLEKKELTHEQVKVERFEIFFDKIGVKANAKEVTMRYEGYLSQECFFVHNALKTLKSLYKDYRLFIVSNGLRNIQEGRIKGSKIGKYFEKIFISQDIGFNKPDERFFNWCFDRIDGFRREEAVIIGDSLSSDIKGGNNAKIKTIWFNNKKKTNYSNIYPDYQINNLIKLEKLLREI